MMDIKKCDLCGVELKSGLATSTENEGKKQAKSMAEIRILNNLNPNETPWRIIKLCESCHCRFMDFIENSMPIYTTLAHDTKIKEAPKLKWWQRRK